MLFLKNGYGSKNPSVRGVHSDEKAKDTDIGRCLQKKAEKAKCPA